LLHLQNQNLFTEWAQIVLRAYDIQSHKIAFCPATPLHSPKKTESIP
jgi:hypothetical protein